jgi:hypothetical protein
MLQAYITSTCSKRFHVFVMYIANVLFEYCKNISIYCIYIVVAIHVCYKCMLKGVFGSAVSCGKADVSFLLWKSCCEYPAVEKQKVVWFKLL